MLYYRSHRMSLVCINLLLIVFFELTFSSPTTNLVPRAFPLKNGWEAPPIFYRKSPGDEVARTTYT